MTRYFNIKSSFGVETVDELTLAECRNSYKEFYKELRRLNNEYHLSGMNTYISQRCTKEWKKD